MINISMMQATHARFDRAFRKMVENTMRDHNTAAMNETRGELQEHVKSGKLLASAKGQFLKYKNHVISRGKLGERLKYAQSFEYGARPHMIYPRRARFLRFIGRRDGAVVFAKKVNHPGNRPYFVMGGAWWKMAARYAVVLRANMHFLAQTEFK